MNAFELVEPSSLGEALGLLDPDGHLAAVLDTYSLKRRRVGRVSPALSTPNCEQGKGTSSKEGNGMRDESVYACSPIQRHAT
jgi:hypothetical protein